MPLHARRWCVTDISCADDLAVALTEHTWCACAGFRCGGYLWLNDANSPDGAQEFAVIREIDLAQVESITFGWMDAPHALAVIQATVRGHGGDFSAHYGRIDPHRIETPAQHGRCPHCA